MFLAIPYLSGERKASKRVGNVAQGQRIVRKRAAQSLQIRKQQVRDTIKDIEAKQKRKKWVRTPHPFDPRRRYHEASVPITF